MKCDICGKNGDYMEFHSKTLCKSCWAGHYSKQSEGHKAQDIIYEFCKTPKTGKQMREQFEWSRSRIIQIIADLKKKNKLMSIKLKNQVIRYYLSIPDGTWKYNEKSTEMIKKNDC